ncbi:hypothetical protein ACTXT7_002208 [Hymenolepis weldensis]
MNNQTNYSWIMICLTMKLKSQTMRFMSLILIKLSLKGKELLTDSEDDGEKEAQIAIEAPNIL